MNESALRSTLAVVSIWVLAAGASAACRSTPAAARQRASGYVEATEVRVGAEVGGRVLDVSVAEGEAVTKGTPLARLDTSDLQIALRRAAAQRDQVVAELRLLEAGARAEDLRHARAQADSALADVKAVESELQAAAADLQRFDALLDARAGSRKQRDDAATRKEVAAARLTAARDRARAANEVVGRLKAGARPEEIAAARARVAGADAQIEALEKNLRDAVLTSPVDGVVTSKLVDAGELVAPRTPLVVVTDMARPWANVYVDAPVVPGLRLGQNVTLVTDGGDRLEGAITFISPRAEFTPRNVQTAEERSRLVYRIKVTVDNPAGVLKAGMPVEAELPR